jgi:hypothetical protein
LIDPAFWRVNIAAEAMLQALPEKERLDPRRPATPGAEGR